MPLAKLSQKNKLLEETDANARQPLQQTIFEKASFPDTSFKVSAFVTVTPQKSGQQGPAEEHLRFSRFPTGCQALLEESGAGITMIFLFLVAWIAPCIVNQFLSSFAKADIQKNSKQVICSVLGPQGPPGVPGGSGAPGNIGRMGLPGKDGRDGEDGQKGEPGDEGTQGRTGNPGQSGPKGKPGAIGKAGLRGLKGPKGPTGKSVGPGKKGPRGAQGDLGMSGPCKCNVKKAISAFSVAVTKSYPKERLPIKFDRILMNEGGNYNASSGKFICHIPGVYYFTYDITLANKHLAIGLVYNGQYKIKTFDANTGNHDIASGSTILPLKQKDEVWLQIFYSEQNGLFYDPYWTDSVFTGFLIYADEDYLNDL